MSERTLEVRDDFSSRHIGPSPSQIKDMLGLLNIASLDELVTRALPKSIVSKATLDLPDAESEENFLARAAVIAKKNKIFKNYIGLGYYGTHTPGVILRNVFENPLWYTAYTPYQAEISQGRMEALLNFQTMITDLTKMSIANASLLDEGTAAAEAMAMAFHWQKKDIRHKIFVAKDVFPQTLEVLHTRAKPLGIEIVSGDHRQINFKDEFFAVIVQYPAASGEIYDYRELTKTAHANGAQMLVAADILSLCLLQAPGEWDADIVFGSTQRFGVPMGFGGPHAAYMATKDDFKRLMPGRLIGVSKDSYGGPALRLALQTREQHIRREKATSNICTAQVLLAVMASMYAVYHGPHGLRKIAERVQRLTWVLSEGLKKLGYAPSNATFFDTLLIQGDARKLDEIYHRALDREVNLGRLTPLELRITLDETTTVEDAEDLLQIFNGDKKLPIDVAELFKKAKLGGVPEKSVRTSDYLTHPHFNSYHSETEMLRYITRLQSKDLSLAHAMIPLGSCTMKLNATSEMRPVTWPEFSLLHPFAPKEQTIGYMEVIHQLQTWLTAITGFAAVSLQPNAGSQGEYAGLLVIRKYHETNKQTQRDVCLIPSSAHGTNPASAVMAGFKVVVVACDQNGNIDLTDLKKKSEEHSANLAALMITYPSTHGVFEETLKEICSVIHKNGGQVYMDGANMNALVGLVQPGQVGPDVLHMNLHKTFSIPHGGGGPGMGPIAVAEHLKNFLPTHSVVPTAGPHQGISAVSAAPWGSASILLISWAYIAMLGREGVKRSTEVAILNANYIAKRLEDHYPILYRGPGGWIAHECILDTRPFKDSVGVSVDDIAKRLIDYGFHAPTMSWPVAGTLMVEPTESESKAELDRFCEAMIAIREEIRAIEKGQADKENNVLRNAPHALSHVTADKWEHPYTREAAAYPKPWVREHKFWAPVGRVDNVYGDRNLICTCPDISEYER